MLLLVDLTKSLSGFCPSDVVLPLGVELEGRANKYMEQRVLVKGKSKKKFLASGEQRSSRAGGRLLNWANETPRSSVAVIGEAPRSTNLVCRTP